MVWRYKETPVFTRRKISSGGCMCWKESNQSGGLVSAHRQKQNFNQPKPEKPKLVTEQKEGTGMGVSRTTNQRKRILEEIGDMLTGSSKKQS